MKDDLQTDIAAIGSIPAVPLILDVVCRTTGMRFAAVARVTEDRWVACSVQDNIAFGLLPGGELNLETTICNEIREGRAPIVIDHAAEDPCFRDHPTPALYGFQSYISMPIIRADGRFFGTLCAIDPLPARVNTPHIIGMFKLFAELIAFHLDAVEELAATRSTLAEAHETATLREQFIAVLGHDLRNPLASIAAGVSLLKRQTLPEKAGQILNLMQNSANRMSGLIDNVLDFARGRLGDGLTLTPSTVTSLDTLLHQIVSELRASQPDRAIEADFSITRPVTCDAGRIAQLASNLLGNALTHGDPSQPIRITASTDAQKFEFSIANAGAPISPGTAARLFHPFTRGDANNQQGLGLGLYIAAEIARAHNGTLTVISTEPETRFTFRMPISGPS